jgi:hypothetical protein
MRGLSAEDLLSAAHAPSLHGFIASAAGEKPGFSEKPGFWDHASVGRVDSALLRLRAATFGPLLPCMVDCPACGELLEFEAPVDGLLSESDEEQMSYQWAGLDAQVEYRLPAHIDLLAVSQMADPRVAESALLDRLILSATHGGTTVAASGLSAPVVEALAADMAAHDAQAGTSIGLTCLSHWTSPTSFDARCPQKRGGCWARCTCWQARTAGANARFSRCRRRAARHTSTSSL